MERVCDCVGSLADCEIVLKRQRCSYVWNIHPADRHTKAEERKCVGMWILGVHVFDSQNVELSAKSMSLAAFNWLKNNWWHLPATLGTTCLSFSSPKSTVTNQRSWGCHHRDLREIYHSQGPSTYEEGVIPSIAVLDERKRSFESVLY